MADTNTLLYLSSLLLQAAAVVFALRMLRYTRVRAPWILLAFALTCMALYRAIGLVHAMKRSGLTHLQFDTFSAIASLTISLLWLLALVSIRRISREEQRSQAAQRAVEQQLASLINNLPASVFIKDLHGKYVMVNARFMQNSDLKLEDVIGKTDRELFPKVADLLGAEDEEVIRQRITSTREQHLERDGKRLSFLVTKFPVYDSDKHVRAVCGVATDVTDLKRAQRELQESADRLLQSQKFVGRVLSTTPDLVYVFDIVERRLTYKNRSFRAFLGYAVPQDEPGQDEAFILEAIHPEDAHLTLGVDKRFGPDDAGAKEIEFRVRHADGTYHWIAAREAVFLRTPEGNVQQILGTAEDVTPRRLAEAERDRLLEEMRRSRAAAEEANTAKDRFLAVLSHELRTPLNPVLMSVSQLATSSDLPQAVREELAMIRRNIDLEVRLIDDLLDIGRVRSGKLRVEPRPTDIHGLLRHVHRICRDEADERKITLSLELHASHDVVAGDPARLQQVFWNVLKNAIKFTPAGGSIRIGTSTPGPDQIEITVKDSGVGIEPHLLERLFNAFEQGTLTERHQFGGLGLGLAISKAIVEVHRGRIHAESEGRDKGARFVIRLPLTQMPMEQPTQSQPAAQPQTGRRRILLVEDHPDTNKVLCRLLSMFGYDVTPAFGVAEALAKVGEGEFDLLISDIGLPDGNGYDLLRQANQIRPTRGICMTGYGMDEDLQKSKQAGYIDHVVKPVDAMQLKDVVARVLSV